MMGRHKHTQGGQSLVEFAVTLPILLLFLLGMVEVGSAMFSYIRIASANREAARLASRGRFTDQTVVARVVSAGGSREVGGGATEPNLRTTGPDANTGVVITHVYIDQETGGIDTSTWISGTMTVEGASGPQVRFISVDDGRFSKMSAGDLQTYLNYRSDVASQINAYRNARDYETLSVESFVIIETFYAHKLMIGTLPFIPNPVTLYFASTLRITQDSRVD